MTVTEKAEIMKQVSPVLAATSIEARNNALRKITEALKSHSEEIFTANRTDLERAAEQHLAPPIVKRLTFGEAKLADVLAGIDSLISLPDPLGHELMHRSLDEGLELYRVSCPIGVLGIIFESRPDALVQISSLAIKSGNCALLKGGRETSCTNRVLFDIIYNAVLESGLPQGCMVLAEDHSEISELLTCARFVDLIIPRGSNKFIQYIMDNTRIPVMGHADGVCHIYVDEKADIPMAVKVITDAKTQYVSVCNAVETLLVNRKIARELFTELLPVLKSKKVTLRGTADALDMMKKLFTESELEAFDYMEMGENDFHTEYLDYILSVKIVDSTEEAIEHINRFGSHHTDCIITQDDAGADRFMQLVDSAGVYHNCSTRFADGFRYGFGAEVGISTGKLHARGPVGLEGLVTYKYKLYGNGHIVADYAEGRKKFNFKDY